MQSAIESAELKNLLKQAVAEVLEERRDLLSQAVSEALEDLALARATEEGAQGENASRDEVLAILKGAA